MDHEFNVIGFVILFDLAVFAQPKEKKKQQLPLPSVQMQCQLILWTWTQVHMCELSTASTFWTDLCNITRDLKPARG